MQRHAGWIRCHGESACSDGCMDYMTYNMRGNMVLLLLVQAFGRNGTARIIEARASWDYLSRFLGPGPDASPAPDDVIDPAANHARWPLAYHFWPGNAGFEAIAELDYASATYTRCYESDFIGPATLTLSPWILRDVSVRAGGGLELKSARSRPYESSQP